MMKKGNNNAPDFDTGTPKNKLTPVFRNGTPKITFDLANVRPYRRDLSAGCPF